MKVATTITKYGSNRERKQYVYYPTIVMHYRSYSVVSFEILRIILDSQITQFLFVRTFFLESKATVPYCLIVN